MKFTPVAISAALLTVAAVAVADYSLPSYASHAINPSALMTQGFFIGADAIYTKDVLAKNVVLSNTDQNPVKFSEPWGFAANVGYETHLGQTGSMIADIEGGYRYMGQLSFSAVTGGVNAVPRGFKLQAGTAMVGLGLQMSRIDLIAKGGAAVEIGGRAQNNSNDYHFATHVVPMVGGELGIAIMPNVKLSAEVDYLFGHQINGSNMGSGTGIAAGGGYRALTGMVGLTYYMN